MGKKQSGSVIPEQIAELLERRSTYQEWLQRLDEVGERYRTEVAERVRGDYEERLGEVAAELESHRSDIESSLDERRAEMNEFAGTFETRSAELEEAELRFQVGEYDETTWEGRRAELTEQLEEIDVGLRGARKAVAELESVLLELSGPVAGIPVRDDPLPGLEDSGGSLGSTPLADMPEWLREPDGKKKTRLSASQDVALEPAPDLSAEPAEPESEEVLDASEETEPEAETEPATSEPDAEEADSYEDPGGDEEIPAAVSAEAGNDEEYSDELAFLESLSLEDTGSFDAVSKLLEEEEDR